MLSILLAFTAAAAECETPFSLAELHDVVGQAKSAIDEADKGKHIRATETLEQRIPCLEIQIPTSEWADFLVTESLIKHLDGVSGWQQSLKTALAIVPEHPDVQQFLLEDYQQPPDPEGEAVDIRDGVVVFIDGVVVPNQVPPLDGVHVVQTLEGGRWRSRLIRNERFPASWVEPPPVEPPTPTEEAIASGSSWATVSLAAGIGAWSQTGLDRTVPDQPIDEHQASGWSFGLSSHGQVHFIKSVGVFWMGSLGAQDGASIDQGRSLGLAFDGFVGASFLDSPISVWVGAGGYTTRLTDVNGERSQTVPHYMVGLAFRSTGKVPIDAAGGGGWLPIGGHLRGEVGATILDVGPLAIRVGGRLQAGTAKLGDRSIDKLSARDAWARSIRWTGGLLVGVIWEG